MKSLISFLSVVIACNLTMAYELPICKTGLLPLEFHGTYKIPSGNTLITLSSKKLIFEGIPNAYMSILSCLMEGKRILTLQDSEPASTQNFSLSKLRNGNLLVQDLESHETQIWILRSH